MSLAGLHAVDLFAGTGWGVAAQRLGLVEHGVELMPEAVATREANGMHTWMRDVWEVLEHAPVDSPEFRAALLIASPPCQTFSMAGGGAGRKALDEVLGLIDSRAYLDVAKLREFGERHDPRTSLVLTPLTYVAKHLPMYAVLEQVPPVLPVWERIADELRGWGYSAWAGILSAEQYGVPQTRKRAVLIARNDGIEATPPSPTHSAYYPRDKARLDFDVEHWVSMAEALGWGMTQRPYVTIAAGTASGGTDPGYLGGTGARKIVATEWAEGRWLESNYSTTPRAGLEPPPGNKLPRGRRSSDEPPSTITSKLPRWVFERPATTIVGTHSPDIVRAPGHTAVRGEKGHIEGLHSQSKPGSVRITAAQASALQSYPAGFDWVGNIGTVAQQIGNAVPPLLAEAILKTFE